MLEFRFSFVHIGQTNGNLNSNMSYTFILLVKKNSLMIVKLIQPFAASIELKKTKLEFNNEKKCLKFSNL